jgi:cytochrome c oxidase assembly protein Cox11
MPVFFYIDPDFVKDPAMDSVNNIVLSYTFFKTGEEEPVVSTAGKETVIPAPAVKPVVKAAA